MKKFVNDFTPEFSPIVAKTTDYDQKTVNKRKIFTIVSFTFNSPCSQKIENFYQKNLHSSFFLFILFHVKLLKIKSFKHFGVDKIVDKIEKSIRLH